MRTAMVGLCFYTLFGALTAPLHAQGVASPFTDGFLERVRQEARSLPGALPEAVHVLSVNEFPGQLSWYVQGAPDEPVQSIVAVFQVRYPDHWVMIDAAGDSATLPQSGQFFPTAWDSARAAQLGARSVIVTHEHHDHVAGLIITPDSVAVARNAILTVEQVETLRSSPSRPGIRLDDTRASRFRTIGYDGVLPLAPGLVLIKAAGHTPGSQMAYVRTESGLEILLAGDVAWNMLGIEEGRQKPPTASANVSNLGVAEDRDLIAEQLAWLQRVRADGVHVVVAHDNSAIESLLLHGVLRQGLDLSR